MRKKRFGVSIDSSLWRDLVELSKSRSVTRSAIVEEALKVFLNNAKHAHRRHACCGLVVATARSAEEREKVSRIIESGHPVIRGVIHSHVEGLCIALLYVEGDSDGVASVSEALASNGVTSYFIPLDH
ncbi:MAG: ribbon-helix-helix domain-containing protein [Fervidicoccaceae archaeon]